MLKRVDLEYFKRFSKLSLPLGHLTLLSGVNSAGKSSILQALLLLHQTVTENEWSNSLLLNGPILSLGSAADVIDKSSGRRSFSIGLILPEVECRWRFEVEDKQDLSMKCTGLVYREVGQKEENELPYRLHFLSDERLTPGRLTLIFTLLAMHYVGAERLGPRETYVLGDKELHGNVGSHGENSIGLLYWRRDEPFESAMRIKGEVPTLLGQCRAWLREFFPRATFAIERVSTANLVTLGIRTSDATDFHRPQHVGYGLTHVLPILIAGLIARPGEVLIVENPEAHLHPAGQSRIGKFLAQVAAGGVQVLLETHSDHVLNGIRRAVKDKILQHDYVALHFFYDRDQAGDEAQVVSPQIDRNGNLDHWPEGFFDQFDKDMSYFAGL